jgi:hypothetical protein
VHRVVHVVPLGPLFEDAHWLVVLPILDASRCLSLIMKKAFTTAGMIVDTWTFGTLKGLA